MVSRPQCLLMIIVALAGGCRFAREGIGDGAVSDAQVSDRGLADLRRADVRASDASTVDNDGDGVPDAIDNCPARPNKDQKDSDKDGVGDVCDNCPAVANANQADTDKDGIGDSCDNCPALVNKDQLDSDADGVGNVCDNCPAVPNTKQEDLDGDKTGDVCDADVDGDSVPNEHDPLPSKNTKVLYYQLGSGTLATVDQSGNWSNAGNAVCVAPSVNEVAYTRVRDNAFLSASDMVVTTSGKPSTGAATTLGLAFRMLLKPQLAGYGCVVRITDSNTARLEIWSINAVTITAVAVSSTFAPQPSYQLRASTAVQVTGPNGTSLPGVSCELVGGPVGPLEVKSDHNAGTVGLLVAGGPACFDFLTAVAP